MRRTPFLVGIDLGTTNCSVGALDARRGSAPIGNPPIVQLTAPSTIEPRRTLPSFLYFPDEHEIDSGSVALPWNRRPEAVAGVFARDRGALAPARQVVSAKSWLAHPGVDRRARLLPWAAEPVARRISPIAASAAYLAHIRDAWNTTVARGDRALRLEAQSIVLTVPASFDDEARELTVEAAAAAGLASLTLLEEPIAAFYAWSGAHDLGAALPPGGGVALVCDVGGGTTDFSLIRVSGRPDAPAFERIAVGDHLLLGGDNLDLALAARLERKMTGDEAAAGLALTQREALGRQASAARRQGAPARR
jgi:molecular chaperone DnaK (HSP70)